MNRYKLIMCLFITFALITSAYWYVKTHDPDSTDFSLILDGISIKHPLGTDILGRDMLSRLIIASISSLSTVICVVTISAILGSIIGILCNASKSFYKNIILGFCDIMISIPLTLLVIVAIALFSASTINLILTLSLIASIKYIRLSINLAGSIYLKGYIKEARANNLNEFTIASKLVLPNMSFKILTTMSLDIAEILILISALSFLGMGGNYDTPNLGTLLYEGKSYFQGAFHLLLGPGLFLFFIVLFFNLSADCLYRYIELKEPM